MSELEELSESGLARRDAMLRKLKAEVVHRRRRRVAARCAAVAVASVAAVLCFVRFEPREVSHDAPARGAPPPVQFARLDFEVVHTEPGILDRHAVSDEELIALLDAADQPTGLIRINGQLFLSKN